VPIEKHRRLAEQAIALKKAWLLAAAMLGAGKQLTEKDFRIPNYFSWENKALKRHITDLEGDFEHIAKRLFLNWKRSSLPSVSAWLAERFDAWIASKSQIFDLGRVHEIEQAIGPLGHGRIMDCPPYGQVLLQGFYGAAIRHPEYHLARDLALLYNLFLDSESIIDEEQRQRRIHTSEHSQSLARSVILTCFNLLEAFVSGLATGFLIEHPNAPVDVRKKLADNKLSLRKRLILFPPLVTQQRVLTDDTKPPFKKLFGECKERRDSFVHCEPGQNPTKWGYVKEEHFHDVSRAVVRETVDLTLQAISLIWKLVHGKEKPSWLPIRAKNGRFERVEVVLRPVTSKE
jgi:hypothetical protein